MNVQVSVYSKDLLTHRHLGVHNPLHAQNPGHYYDAQMGLPNDEFRIGALPGGFSDLRFSVVPRGGLESGSFTLHQDVKDCEVRLFDIVYLDVNAARLRGFVSNIKPSFTAAGETVTVDFTGFCRYNCRRFTRFDKSPEDRDGEMYTAYAANVIYDMAQQVLSYETDISYIQELIQIQAGHDQLFHVVFHQTKWYEVMDQMCDLLNSSLGGVDLLLGKSYVWHVDHYGRLELFKNSATTRAYSLYDAPFRVTRSSARQLSTPSKSSVYEYSVTRDDANQVENRWTVKSLAKRTSNLSCTLDHPLGGSYSGWSQSLYGVKDGVLNMQFCRTLDTMQKWVNRVGVFLCEPSTTITLGLRHMADLHDVWTPVDVDVWGVQETEAYAVTRASYEVTSEEDLKCTLSLGVDRRGLAQQLLALKQGQYHPLTHNEQWGHDDDPTSFDVKKTRTESDEPESRDWNQPYSLGGGGRVPTFSQIADVKNSKRFALGFEHTDLDNVDPDPLDPDRGNNQPGSLVYSVEKTSGKFKPILRAFPTGGIALFKPGEPADSGSGVQRVVLTPDVGLEVRDASNTLKWSINDVGEPDGALAQWILDQITQSGGGGFGDKIIKQLVSLYTLALEDDGTGEGVLRLKIGNDTVLEFLPEASGASPIVRCKALDGTTRWYINEDGTASLQPYHDLVPRLDGEQDLGASNKKWYEVFAKAITGTDWGIGTDGLPTGALKGYIDASETATKIVQATTPTTRLEVNQATGALDYYYQGVRKLGVATNGQITLYDAAGQAQVAMLPNGAISAPAWTIAADGLASGLKVGFKQG